MDVKIDKKTNGLTNRCQQVDYLPTVSKFTLIIMFRDIYTWRNTIYICIVLWFGALLLDIPNFVDWGGHTFDMKTMACSYDRLASYSYTVFFISMFVVIPLLIVLYCNLNIYITVVKSKMRVSSHSTGYDATETTKTASHVLDTDGKPLPSGDTETAIVRVSIVSTKVMDIDKDEETSEKGMAEMADGNHLAVPADSKRKHGQAQGQIPQDDQNDIKTKGITKTMADGNDTNVQNEILRNEVKMILTEMDNDNERDIEQRRNAIVPKDSMSKEAKTKRNKEKKAKAKEMRNEIRLARTLFLIFVCFCICWSPYALLCLIDRYDKVHKIWYSLAILMAHASSTLNSLLYAVTNRTFRDGYVIFIKRVFRKK